MCHGYFNVSHLLEMPKKKMLEFCDWGNALRKVSSSEQNYSLKNKYGLILIRFWFNPGVVLKLLLT